MQDLFPIIKGFENIRFIVQGREPQRRGPVQFHPKHVAPQHTNAAFKAQPIGIKQDGRTGRVQTTADPVKGTGKIAPTGTQPRTKQRGHDACRGWQGCGEAAVGGNVFVVGRREGDRRLRFG